MAVDNIIIKCYIVITGGAAQLRTQKVRRRGKSATYRRLFLRGDKMLHIIAIRKTDFTVYDLGATNTGISYNAEQNTWTITQQSGVTHVVAATDYLLQIIW